MCTCAQRCDWGEQAFRGVAAARWAHRVVARRTSHLLSEVPCSMATQAAFVVHVCMHSSEPSVEGVSWVPNPSAAVRHLGFQWKADAKKAGLGRLTAVSDTVQSLSCSATEQPDSVLT